MHIQRKWVAILLLVLALVISACEFITDVADMDADDLDKVVTEGKELAEDAMEKASEAVVYIDENTPHAKIVSLATEWAIEAIPYGSMDDDPSDDYQDRYRTDAAGLVCYAWQIEDDAGKRISVDVPGLDNYATRVDFDELKGGDIVSNQRSGDQGHVVVFVSWVPGSNQTLMVVLEQGPNTGVAKRTTLNVKISEDGSRYLMEYEDTAPGPYIAMRKNELMETETAEGSTE